MKIKINVKEEHIINGVCGDVKDCAISLAVRDIFPEAITLSSNILIDPKNHINYRVPLPYIAEINVTEFDDCIYKGDVRTLHTGREDDLFFSVEMMTGGTHPAKGKDRLEYVKPFSFEVDIDEEIIFPDSHLEEVIELINNSKNCEVVI